MTAPPMSGPVATPSPEIPPQSPTTAPRRSAGKAVVIKVRPTGVRIAAPPPCSARSAISQSSEGAIAQAALAAVKMANPARKTRLRP